jgi:CHAT domain-containing protein
MWKITDGLACTFATTFYTRLLSGEPVAEALRNARTAIKQAGDATYLSYTLYADPRARALVRLREE